MSAENGGTRNRFLVLCMVQHDAYISQPHPEYHDAQPQDIRDACCVVSQLEDGPMACRPFLRSARRIHSPHSMSDGTSPHRDAFCDFALNHNILNPSEYHAVSQWWILYAWLAAPFVACCKIAGKPPTTRLPRAWPYEYQAIANPLCINNFPEHEYK
jgi:hypothetical protein